MKVKCINTSGLWECFGRSTLWGLLPLPNKIVKGPKFGDVVTVVDTNWCEGDKFYELLEWPDSADEVGYLANQFVPLEEQYEQVSFEQLKKEKPISVN